MGKKKKMELRQWHWGGGGEVRGTPSSGPGQAVDLDQIANCSSPPVPYILVIFHCGRLERIINYCLPLSISALNQVRKAKKGKGARLLGRKLSLRKILETVAEPCGQNTHSRIQYIFLPAIGIARELQAWPPGMESLPLS